MKTKTDNQTADSKPELLPITVPADVHLLGASIYKSDIATLRRVCAAVTSGLYNERELRELASDALKATE